MEGLRGYKAELWQSLRYCADAECRSRPDVYFLWSAPTLNDSDSEE